MKATWMSAIVGTSITLACGAMAQPRSELQRQAYQEGWSQADTYCASLEPGFGAPSMEAPPPITPGFQVWCKQGFDDFINHNQTCNQRIRARKLYSAMWQQRRAACQ